MHSSQVSTRTLRGDEIDFTAEARTIQRAAQMRVTRVVRLAELVFFSTAGGDAWMLDPGDGYAACLVRAGEPLAVPIAESTISLSQPGRFDRAQQFRRCVNDGPRQLRVAFREDFQ